MDNTKQQLLKQSHRTVHSVALLELFNRITQSTAADEVCPGAALLKLKLKDSFSILFSKSWDWKLFWTLETAVCVCLILVNRAT